MNISKKFLLFDLGGVLLENDVFTRLQILAPQPIDTLLLKSRWLTSPSVRHFELGQISEDEFATSFVDEWGLSLNPKSFLAEFASWPTGFYPGALDVLSRLRTQYKVGCLSNSNSIHWQRFSGFYNEFDIAISSHLIGAVKPDLEAFSKALEIYKVDAEDVYFFDDVEENVLAASSLGINAYQVDGFESLMKRLLAEKIL